MPMRTTALRQTVVEMVGVAGDGDAEEADNCCAICLGRLKWPGSSELQCGHVFHRACLDIWWERSSTKSCPTCRQTHVAMHVGTSGAPVTASSSANGPQPELDLRAPRPGLPLLPPGLASGMGRLPENSAITDYLLRGSLRQQVLGRRAAHSARFEYGHTSGGPDTFRRRRTGAAPLWTIFIRLAEAVSADPVSATLQGNSTQPRRRVEDYIEKVTFVIHEGLNDSVSTRLCPGPFEQQHSPQSMKPSMNTDGEQMSLSRHVVARRGNTVGNGDPGAVMVEIRVVWKPKLDKPALTLHHSIGPGRL